MCCRKKPLARTRSLRRCSKQNYKTNVQRSVPGTRGRFRAAGPVDVGIAMGTRRSLTANIKSMLCQVHAWQRLVLASPVSGGQREARQGKDYLAELLISYLQEKMETRPQEAAN